MKKFILSVMVSFVALVASAQVYVGGSFTFAHDGESKVNIFEIAPEVGYSFNDMWGIGGEIAFSHMNPEAGSNLNAFSINPYARFTYLRKGIMSLFLDGSLGFSTAKYKDYGDAENGVKIGIEPGVAINATWPNTVSWVTATSMRLAAAFQDLISAPAACHSASITHSDI